MADSKITALTSISTSTDPAVDPLVIVDVSDTSMAATGTTKKVTLNNLLSSSPTATGAFSVTGLVTAGSATITGDLTVRTTKLLVTATGVGVGAAPANPFDVTSTSGTLSVFKRTGSNGAFIGIQDGSGTGLAYIGYTNGVFSIQTSGSGYSDKYTIATDGTATWSVAGTTAMTLNSTGLGVGGIVTGTGPTILVEGTAGTYAKFNSKVGAKTWSAGYRSGTLQYEIQEDATERFVIANGGNVGIGVTPSTAWNTGANLQVGAQAALYSNSALGAVDLSSNSVRTGNDTYQYLLAGSNQASRFQQRDGAFRWFSATAGTSPNAITFGDAKMTLDASGYLLLGTTDTTFTSGAGYKFGPGATPSNGQVGASSSNGDLTLRVYSTGAAAYRFYVGYGGTVFATSATISAISDSRFKENVQDIDVGLSAILALKPRKFDWKAGKGKDIKGDRGFIAQEFETVFPNLIDEWADPAPEGEAPYKSVRQDLIPVLVKAIQELTARVQTLEAR